LKQIILALFVCAGIAFPQGATSPISGTVVDAQNAVVPNAEVTVTNASTGQTFKITSSEKGQWALASMLPAVYKVSVAKSGFKTQTVTDITVNAGVPATVDIKLEVGQTTETIQVEAGADIIQTESATLSSTVQANQVAKLPLRHP